MLCKVFMVNTHAPGDMELVTGSSFINLGINPKFILNGAIPVKWFMLELIANTMIGRHFTQSFWFGEMNAWRICAIEWLTCSVTPSI